MSTEPSFAIPARPRRRFPRSGGLEYEGDTFFRLRPRSERTEADLEPLVSAVLSSGLYRSGEFFDLPMAVWLVRDEATGDVFRVSIRDGTIRLHVLPATESPGLRRFYERIVDRSDCRWDVECETTCADRAGDA